uniref:Uncharacterized protein n=1 Tax=Candidatus Kentrum eta TaxID=2126337 RepID=A0A450UGS2_9GAMM|nr:MAG: hypothetical protein BECKH772A_GA0070896_100341 [Candidatus Kentron sp. H]VFJ92918.1 MAG: hypothetical protein BECKH772B_GA0070898_100361 [Candidatus Kentron sp. H]VFJ99528.1 MAG: hypothetical protein BECKH772C_GA0070978_100331 [Candidatus Kentron sp. H]
MAIASDTVVSYRRNFELGSGCVGLGGRFYANTIESDKNDVSCAIGFVIGLLRVAGKAGVTTDSGEKVGDIEVSVQM